MAMENVAGRFIYLIHCTQGNIGPLYHIRATKMGQALDGRTKERTLFAVFQSWFFCLYEFPTHSEMSHVKGGSPNLGVVLKSAKSGFYHIVRKEIIHHFSLVDRID